MAKLNEWGKIIKGVNTTQDVNIHSISQQAKKFGNIVNDDGYPKYNIADYMEYLKKDLKESWLNETENRTLDKKSKLSESSNYKYKEVFSFGNEVEYNFFDDDNKLHAITLYMKNNILTVDIENKITSKKIENTYNNIIINFVKKYEPYQIKLNQQNPYIIKSLEDNGYEYNNNMLTKIIKEFIDVYKPIKKNSWNYPEELEDYLIKNDFKQIGSGEFSSVWKSPFKENFVVKIFRSKEYNSSVDKEWYDYCRRNSNNPHLPKVGSLKDFGEWYVIFIEKLESIPNDINVDSMKIFKEAIKQNLKPDDVNFKEKFLSLSSNYDTNFVDELSEIYPTIYDIYQKIVKPRKSIQVRLDLHLSNMMLRGNTLVITDPIKSFLRNV